jgi:cytochrome bd ubiquinol oxidase subunit I
MNALHDTLFWHRLQFAFTLVFHYLFPPLTMGLAPLIVAWKAISLRRGGDPELDAAARFWVRIFAINFAVGVVTGIPMEFQFGTNWAAFSRRAGAVIGHTLGMEGLFAFFLESSFLGLLVFGERRLSRRGHFAAAVALFVGSWLSGYFIVATNAFMQHPVGHEIAADGTLALADFAAFVLNPWALLQYAHNMAAAVVLASFVVAAVGALYALQRRHERPARIFLRAGTTAGLASCLLVIVPTGDLQAKMVARHQPAALAAMEGRFVSGGRAPITLIGQPNVAERRLDNPVEIPAALSFLAYGTFHADVAGLDQFPQADWPDNVELLYYAFHVMAGLGTVMVLIMAAGCWTSWSGSLPRRRSLLWILMLSFPLPYIATTAGWMSAELGRQPWIVHGLIRTAAGASPSVHTGTVVFTLIGFCGLYLLLGLLFLFLIGREVAHGPAGAAPAQRGEGA